MRAGLLLFFFLFLIGGSYAQGVYDPFQNPIVSAVRKRIELKKVESPEKQGQAGAKEEGKVKPQPVNLFKPVIEGSLDKYAVEGIIGTSGRFYLVVTDPKSGRTFVLKEGDAVAPDTVIEKITLKVVTLVKYTSLGGKLSKETLTLKVDTEG
jgi:hypothetical protein